MYLRFFRASSPALPALAGLLALGSSALLPAPSAWAKPNVSDRAINELLSREEIGKQRNRCAANYVGVLTRLHRAVANENRELTSEEFHYALRNVYRIVQSTDLHTRDLARRFAARVKVLVDPQEGFLSKVMMLRHARYTADITTYILHNDDVGGTLLKEITAAYERGVNIRLMVDSQGSIDPLHTELKTLFAARPGMQLDPRTGLPTDLPATIEIRTFNPFFHPSGTALKWYRKARNLYAGVHNRFVTDENKLALTDEGAIWRNRRSHDKLMGTDIDHPELARVILGGRNLAGEYYGLPEITPRTYNDMEVLIANSENVIKESLKPADKQSPTVANLGTTYGAIFDRLFYHLGNKTLGAMSFMRDRRAVKQLERQGASWKKLLGEGTAVDRKLAAMEEEDFLNTGFEEGELKPTNELENIRRHHAFVKDVHGINTGADFNPGSILSDARKAMMRRKKHITIVSPYIRMTREEVAWVQKWLDGDPERTFTVITNSIISGDNMAAETVVDHELGPAFMANPNWSNARGQARIYEYGKADGVQLGGKKMYGKIHAKFWLAEDDVDTREPVGEWAVVSFNADSRSRSLNSEIGASVRNAPENLGKLKGKAESLRGDSLLWGTEEWKQLREHQKAWFKRDQEKFFDRLLYVVFPELRPNI